MPSHRGRHLLAQGTLLVLGIYVLILADSKYLQRLLRSRGRADVRDEPAVHQA